MVEHEALTLAEEVRSLHPQPPISKIASHVERVIMAWIYRNGVTGSRAGFRNQCSDA